jgi:Fe-S cluster assembly protein SufD
MAQRKIITKKRGTRLSPETDFVFSSEMIPVSGNNGGGSAFMKQYREHAWEAFDSMPLPNTSDEPWRRTDLRGLKAKSFRLPTEGDFEDIYPVPDEILQPLVGKSHGGQIVLTPDGVQTKINEDLNKRGLVFTDLQTAEQKHSEILTQTIGQTVKVDEGKFAALTSSLAANGILVYVPADVEVKEPLHSVLWGPGIGLAHLSHIIVWLDEGASLTYVHESASPSDEKIDDQAMHSGIVEIHVGEGANLRFVELQSWGKNVWNFSHERARVAKDGNLDWVFVANGSRLTKSFYDVDLIGEGATGRMSGFYFTDGDQHLDHDTQQNHLAANTTSDLLFKGALLDKSRSVWQGMIYVAPGAQKTDGYQANRNMVLSRQARADSIPGLEIMADDVRCTHGATVGKIDPEEIFYLQSRGISIKDAERLVVEGFFEPIVQRIPFEGVRDRLTGSISEKMK